MSNKSSNIIWGAVFILFGVVIACNSLLGWHINLFFNGWWTLFFIVPALMSITRKGWSTGNVICLALGCYWLIGSQNFMPSVMWDKLLIPVIFVVIGISILTKGSFRSEKKFITGLGGAENEYAGIFSSQKICYPAEKFDQCSLNAVFGEVDLDLRDAIIDEDCVMEISAVFGGVNVRVPENVRVKISSVPLFGGVKNKTVEPADLEAPTIFINATCMFGGVDIK